MPGLWIEMSIKPCSKVSRASARTGAEYSRISHFYINHVSSKSSGDLLY